MRRFRSDQERLRHLRTLRRDGIVLIVVLVLVVMLSLAGFGFLSTMSSEYEAAKHQEEILESEQTMSSVEEMLMTFSELPEHQRHRLGGYRSNPDLFRGRALETMTQEITDSALVSMEDEDSVQNMDSRETAALRSPISEPALADGRSEAEDRRWRFAVTTSSETPGQGRTVRFGLQNESVRLHLHQLLRWDEMIPGAGRRALMALPGVDEGVADSILDWMDPDDQPREFGTESDFYLQLDHPYSCPNRPPEQPEELLLVKGVLQSVFFGRTNDPSRTDETLLTSLNQADAPGNISTPAADIGASSVGWQDLLTCWSAERNTDRRGKPRTFLNMPDLSRLQTELSRALSPDLARFVVLARQHGISYPSAQSPQSASLSDLTPDLSIPGHHQIATPCSLIGAIVSVPSASGTIVIASPVHSEAADFGAQIDSLLDRTTTTVEGQIVGRINILEASPEVLSAIPGISNEVLTQILLQREASGKERRGISWLLTERILDVVEFRRISDFITGGGDVFRGDITVFRATGGPVLRRNVVFSGVTSPAVRLNWKFASPTVFLPVSLLMPRTL